MRILYTHFLTSALAEVFGIYDILIPTCIWKASCKAPGTFFLAIQLIQPVGPLSNYCKGLLILTGSSR